MNTKHISKMYIIYNRNMPMVFGMRRIRLQKEPLLSTVLLQAVPMRSKCSTVIRSSLLTMDFAYAYLTQNLK